MRQIEDRFNHWAQYDYTFMNEEEFTDEFKKYTQSITKAKCQYGKIDLDVWQQPEWSVVYHLECSSANWQDRRGQG